MMLICQNVLTESTCGALLANQVVQMILGFGGLMVIVMMVYVAMTLIHKLES